MKRFTFLLSITVMLLVSGLIATPALAAGPQLEVGTISGVGSAWEDVTLSQSYSSMVVVATANYNSTSDPVAVRIQNASGNSFQVRVDAAGGATPSGISVHYMVVEEGVYTVAQDGVKMEAVKYLSTVTDSDSSWNGQSRSYSNSYSSPVVLGQVMTYADPDFSTFWCRGSASGNPPDGSNLYTGKTVSEDSDTTRSDETIGYIVIEAGSGNIEGFNYVTDLGSNAIQGVGNSPPYSYSISGLTSPSVAIATCGGMNGPNGGWAILYGASPVTATTLNLAMDEDVAGDTERNHISEEVGYIVFEYSGPIRTLTISSSSGGTVTTPGIGDFDYNDGTDADIVASADINYHFVNWTGSAVTAGKVANPSSASTTVLMDDDYTVTANFEEDIPDTTPPTPDPMTWSSVPAATSSTTITMTATTATDADSPPVQYYFDCTNDGTKSSNWQSDTTYVASDLTPDTEYSFRVQARDSATAPNITGFSSTQSATTLPLPAGPQIEVGTISGLDSSWADVTLSQSYSSMVVVAVANYSNTSDPVAIRIRNASGNSFQIRADAAGGATPSGINVHFMVVEEGVYNVAEHGVKMEAVKYLSTVTDSDSSWAGESRTYSNSYTSPVVLGQVMTYADPDFSTFWCRGSASGNPPDSSNLYTGKTVSEDSDTTRSDETIGYVVIEAGSGDIEGINYVADLGSNAIQGVGDSPPYTYSISGLSSPQEAIASLAGMNGPNGGWVILYGLAPITVTTLNLAVDEDVVGDTERNHIAEEVGYIVFGSGGIITRTLSVSSTSGGTVTTPGIGDFDYDDNTYANILASAYTDYHFVEWTGSAVVAGKVANPSSTSTTVLMDADYAVTANFAADIPDTTPPTPDPMTWASLPTATGSTTITMTATTATDADSPPVQYYFECTNDGSKSSNWQSSTTYVASGLTPDTQYSFRVQARDSAATQNETGWSSTQSATTDPPAPTLSVSPTSLSLAAAAGSSDTFDITSNVDWTVSDNQTWLSCNPTSGSNNGTVTVTAQENTGSERTAIVTVSGTGVASKTVTVTQAAGGAAITVSINSGGSAAGDFIADQYYSGGSTYTISRTINTSQITGDIPPQAVLQSERYNESTYTIPNFQAGAIQTVTLYFVEAYVEGAGERLFDVAINGTTVLDNFDIYAEAGGQDIAIDRTFSTTANGNGEVVIHFIPGSIQNPKICGITVSGAAGPILSVSPTSLILPSAAGSSDTFDITSNVNWTVSDNQTWLSCNPTSGSGNGTVTVTAQENTGETSRAATVTVSGTGVASKTVTVTQAGTGGECIIPPMPPYSSLPSNSYLPDPFTFLEGGAVTTLADWECRQLEVAELVQEFELGYMQETPYSATTGSKNGNNITVTVNDNSTQISFSCSIVYPSSGSAPYPAMIGMNGSNLNNTVLSNLGVAVITFPSDQIAQQNGGSSRGVGKFYDMYGSGHSAGALMAWAWGVNRLVDAIEKTPAANIDPDRLGVTGCSRNGKGALIAGCFCDRIKLTIPQESGSGGAASWRVSDWQEDQGDNVQTLHQIVTENVWFRSNFDQFSYSANKLPFDHHMVAGLIAPNALLFIENSSMEWLGNVSTWTTGNVAHKIWEALGIPDHMGYSSVGHADHCTLPSSQQPEITAYVQKFLVGGGTGDTNVMKCTAGVIYNESQWVNWSVPDLE